MGIDVTVVENACVMIPLDHIIPTSPIRRLSMSGIARLQESMRWAGFLENFPLVVAPLEDGYYDLIDGNHRYEAAKGLGIVSVPCIIKTDLSKAERYKLAMQSNNAAETVVPSTLVTYAEFIWARLAEVDEDGKQRYTQSEVAQMMGWGRESVRNYANLQKIYPEAWNIIGTTFDLDVPSSSEEAVPSVGTTVPFTENLLRSILPLTAKQQESLVQSLASGEINKGKFKLLAESYQTRNEMYAYAEKQLGNQSEDYTAKLYESVYSGAYDTDWKQDNHPKLHKLIAALRDEWEQKNSIRLVHGDFYEEVTKVGDGSVDIILTDPPYNIARDNEFELEGRSNISQDFGEWDKFTDEQFIAFFSTWAIEWARVLRDQGSGYVFTSDSYISHLRSALTAAGLHVKATIIWHKKNPGTQVVKTNFKSSVEYILFFTKGEGGHTFNWQGENEMHNFIETAICAGKERLVDGKGNTLHPTQKPEGLLKHFMEISSNRGDMVLDGFMGVGSTGAVAKSLGRKFIGIEQDKAYFDAAQRRLAE